jgi:glycosyltransferase involved in cell wall biosynthesis
MSVGGVQKSLLNLTEALCLNGEQIDVIIFEKNGNYMHLLDKSVNIFMLSKLESIISEAYSKSLKEIKRDANIVLFILKIFSKLMIFLRMEKKFINHVFKMKSIDFNSYDVIVSFSGIPDISTKMVRYAINHANKISWIHSDPQYFNLKSEYLSEFYSNFRKLVFVSKASLKSFQSLCPSLDNKCAIVYNCHNFTEILNKGAEYIPNFESGVVNFVVVSRMDNNSKRLDRVLRAVKALLDRGYVNYKVYFIGDGPDLNYLKKLVDNLKISNLIEFIGYVENPYPYIKNADALLISSDFEGFPMTINEAFILNTPIIATNFKVASEAIRDGIDGIISERNTYSFTQAIENILKNPKSLLEYKSNISNNDFDNEKQLQQFYDVVSK